MKRRPFSHHRLSILLLGVMILSLLIMTTGCALGERVQGALEHRQEGGAAIWGIPLPPVEWDGGRPLQDVWERLKGAFDSLPEFGRILTLLAAPSLVSVVLMLLAACARALMMLLSMLDVLSIPLKLLLPAAILGRLIIPVSWPF